MGRTTPAGYEKGQLDPFPRYLGPRIVRQVSGQEQVVTARVTAVAPLLDRGLRRAAEQAGFLLVGDGDVDVTLRIAAANEDQPSGPDTALDVCLHPQVVVVTVRRAPNPLTARLLQLLLGTLLDARSYPPDEL